MTALDVIGQHRLLWVIALEHPVQVLPGFEEGTRLL